MARDEEERRTIGASRHRLREVDGLPEPGRSLAVAGVAPGDQARVADWIAEAKGLIDGSLKRVWHPNARFMEPGQPVGHWTTERRR